MLGAKVAAAKAVGSLVRRTGRGGGTSLPGKVLTRMDPHAIGTLAARLPGGSIVISATNGKTTTAAMAASILERTGRRLVHNRAGANMDSGVASALLDASRRGGAIDGDLGLFEVDEFWLAPVVEELEPHTMLLGNLFRDQLDRYGELDTIADRWAEVVASRAGESALVLNADDPLVADLGRDLPGVTYFGVEDLSLALPELQHASDSKHCRNCGAAYVYDAAFLGHLGHYHCAQCGRAPAGPRRGGRARRAPRRPQRHRGAAHARGGARGRPPPPRPLQRLQRAGRRLAVPRPGRRARRREGRARERRGRVRACRDDPRRRARPADPADQEPRRSERGPAHAGARARRARPLRRPQRRDRRRPRRVLDLGRRHGAARRPGPRE